MSTSFHLSTISGNLSVSVNLKALSPEQQRQLVVEVLRTSGIAYVPGLAPAVNALDAYLAFYCDPTKAPVPDASKFYTPAAAFVALDKFTRQYLVGDRELPAAAFID